MKPTLTLLTVLLLAPLMAVHAAEAVKSSASAAIWAPVDQRTIEDRADVLYYATEPLKEPLTFAGNASAELFVAVDTPDADWVVKLKNEMRATSARIALAAVRGLPLENVVNREETSLSLAPGLEGMSI